MDDCPKDVVHVCFCQVVSEEARICLSLCVCVFVSNSPRKNPECGGKCSAPNVSKVSAVLLAVSAESGEYVCGEGHCINSFI